MTITPPKPLLGWSMIVGGAFALLAGVVLLTLMLPERQASFWLLILILGLGLAGMAFLSWAFEALEEIAVQQLEIRRQKK